MTDRRRALGGFALFLLVVGAASAAALGAASGEPALGFTSPRVALSDPRDTTAAVTGDPVRGQALYVAGCATCHGQQGEGTAVAPSIATAGAALTDYVLRTGRMPLPAPDEPSRRRPPAYDEAGIAAIVAFVSSLGEGPPIPDVAVSGADVALGRRLYIGNCAACHGAAGTGGAVGGGFVAPALSASDPLTVAEAVTSGPGPMPAFGFDDGELDAIAAYVQALRYPPTPGGLAIAEIGPVAEGFLAGTVGLVTLLVVARWIARGRGNAGADAAAPSSMGDEA